MTINAVHSRLTTCFPYALKSQNTEISFEGKRSKKHNKEKVYKTSDMNATYKNGLGTGVIGALAITLAGIMFHTGYTQKEAKRELQSFLNLVNSENVRKDTFMLKDITKDSVPEIVLYTKEGKNIVCDVAERQVYHDVIVDKSSPIKTVKKKRR